MASLTENEDPLKSRQASVDIGAAADEAAAAIAEDAAKDLARVEQLMGRQHLALYAFIGVFVAVLASAIAYLASRQGPNPVTEIPAKPVMVISSAAPASVRAAKPVDPVAAPLTVPVTVAAAPVVPAAPPPATVKPVEQVVAKPLIPANPATAALADVLPNRMYLQVGSLDKNVAELLTQGLRTKGVPATVAPGVNDMVARIIVGPFDTATEMGVVQKQLSELGFTPFPRQFQASELRPVAQNAAALTPVANKPIVVTARPLKR